MEVEEENEVPVELALFPGCPGEDEMPRTSLVASPRRRIMVELNLFNLNDPWSIKKRLMASDIRYDQSRLLLSTNLVKNHVLPYLGQGAVNMVENGDDVPVVVYDLDTGTHYTLRFKQWTSSKSYVLNDGWNTHFVKRRSLKVGDDIGLYWNLQNSGFHFSVLNRAPQNPMV